MLDGQPLAVYAPLAARLLMFRGTLWLFTRVIVFATLLVFTA